MHLPHAFTAMPDALSYSQLPDPDRLEKAHEALIALAEDPEIIAEMSKFGFGPASPNVAQGNALYTAAKDGLKNQSQKGGDKLEETAELRQAYAAVYDRYQELAAVAEAAFEDQPATLAALGVSGPFPGRQADRLQHFRDFSAAARDPERLPAFEDYEIKEEAFDDFDALVQAFEDALHEAGGSRGDAQHGTDQKDEKMDDLDGWMGRMHRIARRALKAKPQLLEKLGIIVR